MNPFSGSFVDYSSLYEKDGYPFFDDELYENPSDSEGEQALESGQNLSSPPSSNQLTTQSGIGLSSMIVSASSATGAVLGGGLSFLSQKIKNGFQALAPQPVQNAVEYTGTMVKASTNASINGVICFGELIDFMNIGGTKNPLPSIKKSSERLQKHNPEFANCMDIVASQASFYYLRKAKKIKKKVNQAIHNSYGNDKKLSSDAVALMKGTFSNGMAEIADWFLESSEELIAQTIKANILHIAANLADEGLDPDYAFADEGNPFGRLFSVVINTIGKYENSLNEISILPEGDEREAAYLQVFEKLSSELLNKFYPKGAEDLQIFHPTLPCIKLLKGYAWKKMNQHFPVFLYRLYQDTQPISKADENWKEQFDVNAGSLKAEQLLELPSTLFDQFIRKKDAKSLDGGAAAIKKHLMQKEMPEDEATAKSLQLVKAIKELLLTKDSSLLKTGSFLERYLMEHLLYNMSQFLPQEVNDVPLPLYITQYWIQGNVFKKLRSMYDGSEMTLEENEKAIHELLAPFGLDDRETFPLPSFIKDLKWSKIEKFCIRKLPDLLFKNIHEWKSLKKRGKNQAKMKDLLDDFSLNNAVSHMTGSLTDKLFLSLQMQSTLSKKMMALCPSMCADQVNEIDQQWNAFFEDNESLKVLKGFGHQCLEALALQICKDLYNNYLDSALIAKGQNIFENPEDEEDLEFPSSFTTWLLTEVSQTCHSLVINGITEEELKAFQKAVQLKNALIDPKDLEQAKIDRAELDQLWTVIAPKFNHITKNLIKILGYENEAMLPVPEKLRPALWNLLNKSLPHIIFNQFGDIMLPLLEKPNLIEQVENLPEGDLIREGCQSLAKDIVKHLPEWLEGKVETLPGKAIAQHPEFGLSDKADAFFTDILKNMLAGEDPVYENVWKSLESYVEGLLLKLSVHISQMDQNDLKVIQVLAKKTKDDLLALHSADGELDENESSPKNLDDLHSDEAEKILIQFTNDVFACLGIKTAHDLFGIPRQMQSAVFEGMNAKIAKGLLGFYRLDNKIRHHVVKANPIEEHLPTSAVAQAVLALTRFALDKVTDDLTASKDGKLEVISKIYNPLNLWLDKQEVKGFAIVDLFKDVVHREVLNPILANLFGLLSAQSVEPYKQGLADWVNPILTNQVISHLVPLMEKELMEQADFDQAFLMALLPIINRHIKHISQTFENYKEFNFDNFASVAGKELHAGVPLKVGSKKKEDLEGEKKFYKEQAKLIFNLIFPNGKDDLVKILPDLKVSDEQLQQLMNAVEDLLAEHAPQAINKLFNKEMLTTVFNEFFENIIKNFEKPIKIKSKKKIYLTKEEKAAQFKQDEEVGRFVIEAAKLLDLPIKFVDKLPKWAKKGFINIEKNTAASIGAVIRSQFDGKLLANAIEGVLPKLVEKKHVKVPKANMTPTEKLEAQKQAAVNFKKIKRKFVQKSIGFTFRYMGARIAHATDIFSNPTLKLIREGILTAFSFIFVKLIGSIIHFLRIDRFILNRLYAILERNQDKILTILAQPEIHKDMIYHGVEAFEGVLAEKTTA